jgi:hypothetical protein
MTPEEQELDEKRQELERLGTQLSERELELTTIRAELDAFHRRYMKIVGQRYAVLDSIEAQIAERQARSHPEDPAARATAQAAQTRAKESAGELQRAPDVDAERDFSPSAELKKLYKEATRKLHPDLAADDAERARRQKFMVEANLAYEKGDISRLRAIIDEWGAAPENVVGDGVAAELVRTIRKIAQVRRRLSQIDAEIAELQNSDIQRMRAECATASRGGRDLLGEMARDIDARINDARARLHRLGTKASK